MMKTVTIVGASLAGLTSARALRQQGFDGRVLVIGDEPHRPYDRPPLSKQFLAGSDDGLFLETDKDLDLDLEWRLGQPAVGLDCAGRSITLGTGEDLVSDGVIIATGASAIPLGGMDGMSGIHMLRSLHDALALRSELVPGVRLAVIGAGFIGSEVASTAREIGADVTVIEAEDAPMRRVLGEHVGRLVSDLHERAGTRLLTGMPVAGFESLSGRVTAVELGDGRRVEADVVVVGIGSSPNTGWLRGSGINLSRGVVTDERGAASAPGVVAVGDCATVYHRATNQLVRDEHWTAAATRPVVAVKTLLSGGSSADVFTGLPYVWSDQYNQRIQFAGHHVPDSVVEIVDGDPDSGSFVAAYRAARKLVAVCALSSPRAFGKWRRELLNSEAA